jgi:hypothetical protein
MQFRNKKILFVNNLIVADNNPIVYKYETIGNSLKNISANCLPLSVMPDKNMRE